MTETKIKECLGKLSLLKRFPANPHALLALADLLSELCQSDEEGDLLVRKILGTHDEWCGPVSLRDAYWEKVASRQGCATCKGRGMIENYKTCACALGRYYRNHPGTSRPWIPPEEPKEEAA